MRILLTGANGYIGQRLLPVLIEQGHEIICCVRDQNRFEWKDSWAGQIEIFEIDFLDEIPEKAPVDFDVAYYLIHSMSSAEGDFEEKEQRAAVTFLDFVERSNCQQIVYLTGIINEGNQVLSKHLRSRRNVENILGSGRLPLTALRAAIIVGSGSASFEIIRDLVEKLPVMVTPKWVDTKCQPIAIRNVISYLTKVALCEECMGKSFDIGGPEVLTYKEMLYGYAKARKLQRWILTVPVMTPKLSSYWLYFVTATSYPLAINLVDSMKVDVVAADNRLQKMFDEPLIPYTEAVALAFEKIEQNMVISSWKDSLSSSMPRARLNNYISVPQNGVFRDFKKRMVQEDEVERVKQNLWAIGGERGWYYGNILWKIRGYLDKIVGGVGLRRGRTSPIDLNPGDALDFWRVLVADRQKGRLLLYAEMKLPGEAWLEFRLRPSKVKGEYTMTQVATFRPDGLFGRLYWYSVLPFHYFVFDGMIRNIIRYQTEDLKLTPVEESTGTLSL